MRITFDPAKRAETLRKRRIDFRDAERVFAGLTYTIPDQRLPYPEERFITVGLLSGRMVIVVWTPTEDGRRIISMRKANAREQARYSHRFG
jgi:uncharacterized DUF497 family protein